MYQQQNRLSFSPIWYHPQVLLSDLMMLLSVAVLILSCISRCHSLVNVTYVIDDTPGYGRRFDGIGGLSGGGVSC